MEGRLTHQSLRRVGYVLNAFPVVSETFILNEIRAVEASGLPVLILSLDRPHPSVAHAALAELRAARAHAPSRSPSGRWRLLRAHLSLARSRPGRYLRVLREDVVPALSRALSMRSGTRRRARKRLRRFARAGWVAQRALRGGVTHLHAHYAKEPLEITDLARRLADLSYSFTAHAKDLFTTPAKTLRRRLRTARFAVTCHRAGHQHLRALAHARDRDKVVFIPHGIDTRLFQLAPDRREAGLILSVGRLTPKKGFEDLVDACALLARRGVRFRCEIVGEGRLQASLESAIESHGLQDRVRLRRFVPQEQLPELYARAGVVAVPSRVMEDGNRDGIPNVLLEAMATGAPVVACEVGGIPEAVEHGKDGLLSPSADAGALAAALQVLIEHPERARELGRSAARKLAGLDFRECTAGLVERLRSHAGTRAPLAGGSE